MERRDGPELASSRHGNLPISSHVRASFGQNLVNNMLPINRRSLGPGPIDGHRQLGRQGAIAVSQEEDVAPSCLDTRSLADITAELVFRSPPAPS
ncbi:Solute Carrier Family 10 Member 6 [Manis pentadactyla]|nr:Solute Carrier Family 10 Member 6 [Manis pentadactyla]